MQVVAGILGLVGALVVALPASAATNTVTVTTEGAGTDPAAALGRVTSDPVALTCTRSLQPSTGTVVDSQGTCNAPFDSEGVVTIVARPLNEVTSARLSGDGCDTGTRAAGLSVSCTVTMERARSLTATFTSPAPRFSLGVETVGAGSDPSGARGQVTSDPTGLTCTRGVEPGTGTLLDNQGTCSLLFDPGAEVTVTARTGNPTTSAQLTGDGCDTGPGPAGTPVSCTVTMDRARALVATFTSPPPRFPLNVTTRSGGRDHTAQGRVTSQPSGVDCRRNYDPASDQVKDGLGTCTAALEVGTEVTLTATPGNPDTWAQLTGGGCNTVVRQAAVTCTVTMDRATDVVASFSLPQPLALEVTRIVRSAPDAPDLGRGSLGAGVGDSSPSFCTKATFGTLTCRSQVAPFMDIHFSAVPADGLTTAELSGACAAGPGARGQVVRCTVRSDRELTTVATFTYHDPATLPVLTVTPTSATRVYGEPPGPIEHTISGFLDGETLETSDVEGEPFCFAQTGPQPAVSGDLYPIICTQGTLSSAKYRFEFATARLTVTKAPLTVTAHSRAREYGRENPPLTTTMTGFRYDDDRFSVSGAPTCTTTATITSPVAASPYPITCSTGTLSAENYDFVFADGELTVVPALLRVNAHDDTREYGAPDPAYTATITGFRNGEDASIVTGEPRCLSNASRVAPVAGSPYDIFCLPGSLSAPNYGFAGGSDGVLTLTRAPLTVTADNQARPYGGTNAPLTTTTTGFRNGEDASVVSGAPTCTTAATPTSPLASGPYPIECTAGSLSAANYEFRFAPGELEVTPAPLTVRARDAARTYGAANPVFAADFDGFVNGEGQGVLGGTLGFLTDATTTSDPGQYDVTPAGLTSTNYAITFQPGTLTVSQADVDLFVRTVPSTTTYGGLTTLLVQVRGAGATPTGTVTFSDGGTVLGTVPLDVFDTASTASILLELEGGTHSLTATYNGDARYSPATAGVTHVVNPAATRITAAPLLPNLFRPTATLVRDDTGAPVSGETVRFVVGGRTVCTAVTDDRGVAVCRGSLVLALGGYRAEFAGSDNHLASSAEGSLL